MPKICAMTADGLEEIECLAVVDILRRQGYDVRMVSVTGKLEITGAHGIRFMADELFDEEAVSAADMVFLPGGMPGTTTLGAHEGLVRVIHKMAEDPSKRLAAICAAPSVLGVNGILKGKRATAYPGFEDKLVGALPAEEYVVTDGQVTTARGMGAAVELGLEIIRVYDGEGASAKMRSDIQCP